MAEIISSKDNKVIKHIAKLISSSKYRRVCKEFAIEGLRLCKDAFFSKVKVITLLYTEKARLKNEEFLVSAAKLCEKSYVISEEVMKRLCTTETPQGIICVCECCETLSYNDILNDKHEIKKIIMLENIQDPSNMGTILRTAEALGVDGVILTEDCCDVYSPKVLRGSMGAVFRLPITLSKCMNEAIKYLKLNNINVYAAVPSRLAVDITDMDFRRSCAVILGNEGNGIREETINICDKKIMIPMLGQAESLNVSIASGIIMWEMMRGG